MRAPDRFTFEINKGQKCSLNSEVDYQNMLMLCRILGRKMVYIGLAMQEVVVQPASHQTRINQFLPSKKHINHTEHLEVQEANEIVHNINDPSSKTVTPMVVERSDRNKRRPLPAHVWDESVYPTKKPKSVAAQKKADRLAAQAHVCYKIIVALHMLFC